MFNSEQITDIERRLARGESPAKIAADLGMALSSFRIRLSNSGYRVRAKTRRDLEPISVVRPVGFDATIASQTVAV